jgi:hypothetical protein
MATWYLRAKRYDEAQSPLTRLLEIEPAHPRALFLQDVLERARRTGADPSAALDRRNGPPRPSVLAITLVSCALALALALGVVEPMASAFGLALVMAAMTIHGARLRSAPTTSGGDVLPGGSEPTTDA